MNILILADYCAPNSGNFVASLIALGREIRHRGGRAAFLFPQCGNTLRTGEENWCRWFEREGFPVVLFDLGQEENLQLQKLLQLIKRHEIDTLHIHFGLLHGLILKHRCAFRGKKILVHDHMDFPAGDAEKRRSKRNSLLYAWAYRLLGIGYVAVSAQKYAFYHKIVNRCWYLPNGISYERNIPVSLDRRVARSAMGIDESQRLCLFLGWSLDIKGLDIAIKAVHEYRKTCPDLVLAIVGFGKEPSQKASRYIEEKTGISVHSPWIRYLESTEDMYAYHKAADVYLSASRTESFSYGLLEAISQNTPVAVSDIEGTRWAWEYTKCFPYPVEDEKQCAQSLKKAIQAGKADSNAGDLAARYNIQDWCKKMTDIYAG